MIRHFTLSPEDSQRAIDAGGPLQDLQLDATKLATMRIAVVEVDGQLVAYWVVWYALHVEPLWIHPDHRKSAPVVRGIVDQLTAVVHATQEPVAYAEIATENLETIAPYAERLGFQQAPGTLFYLIVQPPDPPAGE